VTVAITAEQDVGYESPGRGTGKLVVARKWSLSGSYERATGLVFTITQVLPGLTALHQVPPATFRNGEAFALTHFVSASAGQGELRLFAGAEELADGEVVDGFAGLVEGHGY
jgi:hypothetical protein